MTDSTGFATNLTKKREIVLDTETTGLSPDKGDRIVDIGCVELENHIQTGNTYHVYINPEKPMSADAVRITGITDEFLQDKPTFKEIADQFLEFVGDGTLVIHNASFDIAFLNSELERIGKPLFKLEEAVDTLDIAHRKFPGAPANLNALCKRFGVDTAIRDKHGALVDCLLLAEVYIYLLGGKQAGLDFTPEINSAENISVVADIKVNKQNRKKRIFKASEEEISAHEEFLQKMLGDGAMWYKVVADNLKTASVN